MMNNTNSVQSHPFAPKLSKQAANDPLNGFVCSWLKDQKIRDDLTKRIKYKKEQGEYSASKVINDQSLTHEYYKIWMQQPASKPLMKLAMHPLLTVEDQQQIDTISVQQRNAQIKLASYLTLGTVAFYWVFLSRMGKFQRFFNDRNKNRFMNMTKKVVGVYAVLIVWQASLTSHYEKMLPEKIHQKGLFKKYGIEFGEKNV